MRDNKIISIKENEVSKKAAEYFARFCGLYDERMLYQGMKVRESGLKDIDIKAVVSPFGGEVYRDNKVEIEGSIFKCEAFGSIDDNVVKGVYIYLLTAGECQVFEDDCILVQLLADMWGTAYIAAALDLLKSYIGKEIVSASGYNLYLSNEFGPGLYGMDIRQSMDFFNVLNAEGLGMRINESGAVFPSKSCFGLFLAVSDPQILPEHRCVGCDGNKSGCNFCKLSYV